jgi:hypothetical protein
MRRRFYIAIAALLLLAAAHSSALADRITPPKPLFTEVHLKQGNAHDSKIVGNLVSYDDDTLTINVGTTPRDLKWIDLTPASAFTLRSRLIDKSKAMDWLTLAKFAWSIDATDQTHTAVDKALSIDPKLKAQADEITAAAPGSAVTAGGKELLGTEGQTANAPANGSANAPARPNDNSPAKPTLLYQAATPAEYDEAITNAHKMARTVEETFNVKFTTIETPHFLIFTDWDPREFDFLKTNFEDAYRAVTEQFNIPYSQNVFIGKLPVLMFAKFSDYAHLTDSIGFYGKPVTRSLRGYFEGQSDGSGRMVMYKPGAEDIEQAELQWAHALVHEFTHAFVARYHSNARVPRWLNEGVAEVIASQHFPYVGTNSFAKRMAAEHKTAGTLFDDKIMPSGDWYPVMQTMVEYLIAQDKDAFLKMFDAIKAGTDGEEALQKFYGLDYASLMSAWRKAVLKMKT